MDVNAKLKLIAETMSGYTVIVDTSNGANVKLDKTAMPCILIFIQDTGEFKTDNSHYRDSVNIRVALLNKMPKGFTESDVEAMRYILKQDMILLYHKLKYDFQFTINNNSVKYELVYDEMDANLLGVVFNDSIKERVGINLACETPDSIGQTPSAISFCQKVSECGTIISMQELIDSLQEQIDNLPTTTGVESVSGNQVNNTDPLNPIVEPLGLIKIIDIAGTFFTDLSTAVTYIEQFFLYPTIITNKSFNNGVFYFTVPSGTVMESLGVPFLNNYSVNNNYTDVSFIDEFGLITEFQEPYSFFLTRGKMYFVNAKFAGNCFQESILDVEINDLSLMSGVVDIGLYASGTIKIKGNIGTLETQQYSTFFTNGSATILANARKYTSNAGGIHGDLANAIANGVNVFFDGIDKEDVKNKVLNFNSPNNTDYATTQATISLVDNRVQSNIKIIGDWDATSGSMPLDDESNTTPFITMWGSTIKQGWAFRVGYGQAGTVGGYDYEEGDVVYALLDSAGPTPADWGDLDHNLQQATETLRGTGKVITAAIIADETNTDDERFVTGIKLWQNFWTRVLAIAHTFAAKITFSSPPRFSSVNVSEVLVVDSNKDLSSEAKGSAFNKNFGTTVGTVLEGNSLVNYLKKSSTISFTHSNLTVVSGNTYFFGTIQNTAITTTSTLRRGVAPFTGFVYSGSIVVQTGSTLGVSAGFSTLTLNNITAGTSVVLFSSIKYDVNCNVYHFELLTPFAVTAGDSLELQVSMPTFSTAPNSVQHFVNINIGLK